MYYLTRKRKRFKKLSTKYGRLFWGRVVLGPLDPPLPIGKRVIFSISKSYREIQIESDKLPDVYLSDTRHDDVRRSRKARERKEKVFGFWPRTLHFIVNYIRVMNAFQTKNRNRFGTYYKYVPMYVPYIPYIVSCTFTLFLYVYVRASLSASAPRCVSWEAGQ